jgi:hypothetical protein
MDSLRAQRKLIKNDIWKCGLCQNHCITAASCKTKEIITLDRCFWEELLIEYLSITLTVGSHQQAPYGYWRHTNNAIGKELIFLNTASNNFLEGTNYNYSCRSSLNIPMNCMENFVMPEIRTINGMPNTMFYNSIIKGIGCNPSH